MYGVHLSSRDSGRWADEHGDRGGARTRAPLTRERVLRTAVALADQGGVEALSMRKLAQALDVVPMALYRHVANKDELLDGLVDVVIGEIDPPLERRRLEDGDAGADPLGPARAPPSSVGVAGDGVAHHAHAGRARLHGLDDRDAPHRGLLARPHPPRAARDGQPDRSASPRSCSTTPPTSSRTAEAAMWEAMADTYPFIHEIFVTISHDDRVGRRPGLRRSVRVRVRAGSDARRHSSDSGSGSDASG